MSDVGRPPKYNTPEEMQEIIDLYFDVCKANETEYQFEIPEKHLSLVSSWGGPVIPTVAGLSLALGMSRQALLDYEKKDEFLDTVKRAKQRIEAYIEQRLFGNNVTGVIFNLKNNFGWRDKQDVEHSGGIIVERVKFGENTDEKTD